MADVGTEFTDFLRAYCLEDYNKLSSDSVTSADINAIFAKHKAKFDAWRKIPQWQRDKYYNKVPEELLEKAAKDPNFTETDAIENEEKYLHKNNPYSPIPEVLEESVFYHEILNIGVQITPAHIAAMKLAADQFNRNGYSAKTSEQLSMETIFNKALFERYAEISQDKTLSLSEQREQKARLEQLIDESRLRRVDIAFEDVKQNQPERALMLTLRSMQRGKIDRQQALPEIDAYVKRIIESERMDLLAAKMNESLYQKVLKPEIKEVLDYVLRENKADIRHLDAMKQKVIQARGLDHSRAKAPAKDLQALPAYARSGGRESR